MIGNRGQDSFGGNFFIWQAIIPLLLFLAGGAFLTTNYFRMTIEEFDKTGFAAGDFAKHKHGIFPIVTVDFEEKLIGLQMKIEGGDPEEISWVRCENIIYKPITRKGE